MMRKFTMLCTLAALLLSGCADVQRQPEPLEIIQNIGDALGEEYEQHSVSTVLATLVYESEDGASSIRYHILQTTYCGEAPENLKLHIDAFSLVFEPEDAELCESIMIRECYGAIYRTADRAYLCWTCSPEISCVLEYDPEAVRQEEIVRMARSVGGA